MRRDTQPNIIWTQQHNRGRNYCVVRHRKQKSYKLLWIAITPWQASKSCVCIIYAHTVALKDLNTQKYAYRFAQKAKERESERTNIVRPRSNHFYIHFSAPFQYTAIWICWCCWLLPLSQLFISRYFFILHGFIMSSFIFILSVVFPHSLHSLKEQHKTVCAEFRANQFSFIMAFYRNSNFHMKYNMIFLFLVFIHSRVDEWDATVPLHKYMKNGDQANAQIGKRKGFYFSSHINID